MKTLFTTGEAKVSLRAAMIGAALAGSLCLAYATPSENNNCANCHNDAFQNGMVLTNFNYTTNLGAGLRKVYQVLRGQTASIRWQVFDDFGANYALCLRTLTAGGVSQPTNHMSYTGDASWTLRASGAAFTTPVSSGSPQLWTHNLLVLSNTPADIYPVQTQMAGDDGNLWSQTEDFYIRVLAPAAVVIPPFSIASPMRSNQAFSVRVLTVSGATYFLEYRTNLAQVGWLPAAQTPGDGTTKTITDATATGPTRFYRVRAQ